MLLAWSGGKDSALTLERLRADPDLEVVALLTTLDERADAVAMHGVPRALLEAQADAIGLPLWDVSLPFPCPNEVYDAAMAKVCARAKEAGIGVVAFGDLFLEDIRAYREDRMQAAGLRPIFPVFGEAGATPRRAQEVIDAGIVAHLVCLDPKRCDRSLLGRAFDASLLAALPEAVDPMGENGEFHTFVVDAPSFRHRVPVAWGEPFDRDGYAYRAVAPGA